MQVMLIAESIQPGAGQRSIFCKFELHKSGLGLLLFSGGDQSHICPMIVELER